VTGVQTCALPIWRRMDLVRRVLGASNAARSCLVQGEFLPRSRSRIVPRRPPALTTCSATGALRPSPTLNPFKHCENNTIVRPVGGALRHSRPGGLRQLKSSDVRVFIG